MSGITLELKPDYLGSCAKCFKNLAKHKVFHPIRSTYQVIAP